MILAKVVSRVVSTAKLNPLQGRTLLMVQPIHSSGHQDNIIAIDSVQAGPGDTVLVMQEGTGARQILLTDQSHHLPAQAVIVGIVDKIYA